MRKLTSHLMLAGTLVVAGTSAQDAFAVTASRTYFNNAAGICQPALPAFDGNIRKRPTAVANEGTATAFVSCSFSSNAEDTLGASSVQLTLFNRTASAVSVTCTMNPNYYAGGVIPFIPKTISMPAGRTDFLWNASENGGNNFLFMNFSCALPPGVDVGYGFYNYNVNVGA
ncbi:MAG: hypothetical protein ABJA62_02800 [Luteimonas sp.]